MVGTMSHALACGFIIETTPIEARATASATQLVAFPASKMQATIGRLAARRLGALNGSDERSMRLVADSIATWEAPAANPAVEPKPATSDHGRVVRNSLLSTLVSRQGDMSRINALTATTSEAKIQSLAACLKPIPASASPRRSAAPRDKCCLNSVVVEALIEMETRMTPKKARGSAYSERAPAQCREVRTTATTMKRAAIHT
jgi:hypothetical protein